MRYGTVVQFFPDKGFGFIRPDSGADVFFHISALGTDQPEPEIKPGQPVKFELLPRRESEARRRTQRGDRDPEDSERSERAQAKVVELIDRIPGGVMKEGVGKLLAPRHPRARHKKPTWR